MIAGYFHAGSGLGDQLHRYITVRSLAERKGLMFGMVHPENYKGRDFMPLDLGNHPSFYKSSTEWNEREFRSERGADVRSYDPDINFIEDNTLIDGSFEDDKYWRWNLPTINTWLKVEPLEVADDVCVIGFRGGEYATVPELFLPRAYFAHAMEKMPGKRFEVHTDDPMMAREYLQVDTVVDNSPLSHSKHTNMGYNWRSARFAKYAIIPNSAFFILPRILKHQEDPTAVTIAPRFWAGRNVHEWRRPACYYPEFTYL